jgi:serine/threonine-protein kinase
LPAARIVDILSQALSALAVAHDMGIIHRDLKPENIMVLRRKGEDERIHDVVKVCDFGIAKVADTVEMDETVPADGKKKNSKLTTAGLVIGTPEYMSPEQGRGEPLDARCDLYSMGVILYLLLSGQTPFDAPTPLGIVLKHQSEEPLPPSRYRPEADLRLEAVCLKAMSKRPSDRYATAREMRNALRALVDTTTSEMTVPPGRTPSGNIAHARTELLVPPPTQVVQSGGFHTAHTEALVAQPAADVVHEGEAARATTGALTTPTGATRRPSRAPLIAIASILALGVVGGGAFYGRTLLQAESDGPPTSTARLPPPPPLPPPPRTPAAQVPSAAAPTTSALPRDQLVQAPITSPTAHREKGGPLGASAIGGKPLGEAVNAMPSPPPEAPRPEAPVAPPSPPPQAPPAPAPPPAFEAKLAHVEVGTAKVSSGGVNPRAISGLVSPGSLSECYRQNVTASSFAGTSTLHITTDEGGNVQDAEIDGPLSDQVKACITRPLHRKTVQNALGSVDATIPLTFKLQ